MRVAYVCADPGVPVFGNKGCSVHVREVIAALRRAGATVDLLAARFDGPKPVDWDDVTVYPLPDPPKGDAAARESAAIDANRSLGHLLSALGSLDVVYERYSLWSSRGMTWARDHGVAGILEVNAPLIDEQAAHRQLVNHQKARSNAAEAFSAAAAVIAVSDRVAQYVRSVAPLQTEVHVAPNGVDLRRFRPDVLPALPKSGERFVIGFSGSMKPWHGLDRLVDAFEIVLRGRGDTHLLLVGDGTELRGIRAVIESRGMLDHVTFAGAVGSELMPAMLTSMHVAVAPYPPRDDFYFSPLKIVEYMAAGRAIVASRIGQIESLLSHEQTGLLVAPGDTDALAESINRLRDAGLRRRLGQGAREAAVHGHSWDDVAARIISLSRRPVEATA